MHYMTHSANENEPKAENHLIQEAAEGEHVKRVRKDRGQIGANKPSVNGSINNSATNDTPENIDNQNKNTASVHDAKKVEQQLALKALADAAAEAKRLGIEPKVAAQALKKGYGGFFMGESPLREDSPMRGWGGR